MIKIGNYTSHGGTVGAVGDGHTEEAMMLDYVKNYLNPLYQKDKRFDAYWWGDEAHEMDTDDKYINNSFHLSMSHHMDGSASKKSTGASMLWNQNPAKIKEIGSYIGARITKFGIPWRGNIERHDLDMLYGDNDNVPRGLFEIGFITNTKDHHNFMNNKTYIARIEYEAVCHVFGIKPLGKTEQPSEDNNKPEPMPWTLAAKGAKYGDETVLDAYEEVGKFTFKNIPAALMKKKPKGLSIYPDFDKAMLDKDADPKIGIVNKDVIPDYWAVIRTDKYDYILYTRDNKQKGCVSIRNKKTGQSYGIAE